MNDPELTEATRQGQSRQWCEGPARLLARPGFVCLLLAVVTLAVFWPARNWEFINYDDPEYVTSNPHVRQGFTLSSVVWAFRTVDSSNWHPVTWLSHLVDVQLFGMNPAGPHVVNVLFHVGNTVLLFVVLRGLTGGLRRSAWVAGLFALHPLHVESVAWVSERKDVLSGFFFLLTLWAYGRYAQKKSESRIQNPGARSQNSEPTHNSSLTTHNSPLATRNSPFSSLPDYGLALLFFVLGLMSKSMLVTLPFVLLLLDYWPLNRVSWGREEVSSFKFQVSSGELSATNIQHSTFNAQHPTHNSQLTTHNFRFALLVEKIPFFALSGLFCVITLVAQSKALVSLAKYPISVRAENAVVSCARYLGKVFWPVNLALPYPHPGGWPLLEVLVAAVVVAGICAGVWALRRRLPYGVTGWFWFLGMLIPVIGLVQVGIQSMADRYSYLPLIGLFIMVVWGGGAVLACCRVPAVWGVGVGVMVLVACGLRTRDQLRHWRSSETLFGHSIAVTQDNYLAHDNLGFCLNLRGRTQEALDHYREALRINPDDFVAYNNIGFHFFNLGLLDEAITYYHKALRINPGDPGTLNNLGTVLVSRKDYAEAIQCFKAALRARPDYVEARNNLGIALDRIGKTGEAIQQFVDTLRLAPDDVETHNNYANALVAKGRIEAAIDHYRRALKIDPSFTQALNNLGYVLASQGKFGEAVDCYDRALRLKPEDELLHKNLGRILAQTGRVEEALRHFTEALRLAPMDAEAHFGMGWALAQTGRRDEAVEQLKEALRLKPDYADAKRVLQALATPGPE